MSYVYETEGVCPITITVSLKGDVVEDVVFDGGCDGNLKAIRRLVKGMTVRQTEACFSDITCNKKHTSCTAQMAIAVRKTYEIETHSKSIG